MIDRMVDLAVLFTEGIVYLSAMKGSFTLKNIIQVINPELNYAALSIGHGLEAVKHYRTLENNDDEDEIKDAEVLAPQGRHSIQHTPHRRLGW